MRMDEEKEREGERRREKENLKGEKRATKVKASHS